MSDFATMPNLDADLTREPTAPEARGEGPGWLRIARRYRPEAALASQQDIQDGHADQKYGYCWTQDGALYAGDGFVLAAVPCQGSGAVSERAFLEARRGKRKAQPPKDGVVQP